MARVSVESLQDVLPAGNLRSGAAEKPPNGLSKRQILKMLQKGVPEPEILAAIAENGSKATLTLDEALALRRKGVSRDIIAAIEFGKPAPGSGAGVPAAQAAPTGAAAPEGAPAGTPAAPAPGVRGAPSVPGEIEDEEEEIPLLEEIAGDDESLDAILEDEEAAAEEAPLLEEILGEAEGGKKQPEAPDHLMVTSAPPGARLFVAPAATRLQDLPRVARSAGRTPAPLKLPQGAYFLLVEKQLEPFDTGMIPAFRTVHDGSGGTRTLVTSGTLVYDARRCCLPRSLKGEVAISRIGEDQQGSVLGDEFNGLPPYLWDGNRYLLLGIRGGRISRVVKVYEVRKAAGEVRNLVASFIASSTDPLAEEPAAPAVAGKGDDAPVMVWEPPAPADLQAVGRVYGIPKEGLERLGVLLAASGKATWKGETAEGGLTLLTLSLDTLGRMRLDEVSLRKDGPHGTLSTPAPPVKKGKKAKKVEPPPPPPALPAVIRAVDPDSGLPLLTVENTTKSGALVRLGDGTMLFVGPGETRDVTVTPGSTDLEARFDDKPQERRAGRAQFTYHARYRLKLT